MELERTHYTHTHTSTVKNSTILVLFKFQILNAYNCLYRRRITVSQFRCEYAVQLTASLCLLEIEKHEHLTKARYMNAWTACRQQQPPFSINNNNNSWRIWFYGSLIRVEFRNKNILCIVVYGVKLF